MENSQAIFHQSLGAAAPPENFSVYLRALWYDRKGLWNQAHGLIDQLDGRDAARLHAYLHRKEGDAANAGYWYRRAGIPAVDLGLDAEWELLLDHFLKTV